MSQRVVFISGIGADRRAFQKLILPFNEESVHVDWIPLNNKKESFDSYCDRLIIEYQLTSNDILIGLSFGGLIAQYVAKNLHNDRIILISSFRNKSDLRSVMNFGLKLKLHLFLPSYRVPLISSMIAAFLNSWKKESRKVLIEMLNVADFKFINWSIRQIDKVNLRDSFKAHYLSLTGTNDKLVTDWSSIKIRKGSHFMVFDCSEQISELINDYLHKSSSN